MNLEKLEKVKALRAGAAAIGGFHAHYSEKYGSDPHYDKKGYGFGRRDNLVAFDISTSFSTWAGTYGNSSVSPVLYLIGSRPLVEAAFVKAISLHQKELFATVARLMREEAATLVGEAEEEIRALNQMLDDARSAGVDEDGAIAKAQGRSNG